MKIAVIAHDGKKAEMVAFLNRHMDFLTSMGLEIVATGTTGKHAQDAGLKVERLLSGPLGGESWTPRGLLPVRRLPRWWRNIRCRW